MSQFNIVEEIQKNLDAGKVVEYSSISSELSNLKDKYGTVVPDMSSKDGYDFSKEAANTCRDIRKNLEAVRKDKKQPYLDYGRLIDSQAKDILGIIQGIETPHKESHQAYDAKKKAILEERKQTISDMNNIRLWGADKSEGEIKARIDEIQCMDMSKEAFGRLLDDAVSAQSTAVESLYQCHAQAVDRRMEAERIEAERIELEALRSAQRQREEDDRAREQEEEKQRLSEESRQREHQAAEQARINAENIAKENAERLEREKSEADQRAIQAEEEAKLAVKQAEERAKLEVEQSALRERQRIEAEQAKSAEEAAAREADKKHRGAINSAVMGSLIAGGLSEDQAKMAVKLIAGRKVPHVTISY